MNSGHRNDFKSLVSISQFAVRAELEFKELVAEFALVSDTAAYKMSIGVTGFQGQASAGARCARTSNAGRSRPWLL